VHRNLCVVHNVFEAVWLDQTIVDHFPEIITKFKNKIKIMLIFDVIQKLAGMKERKKD
jgi:hypothetical protein